MEVQKHHAHLLVSDEALADMAGMADAFARFMRASPEERAAWAREAAEQRAAERAAAVPVPLNLGALLQRMGWSREYAEHLVQPYCDCGPDGDGWNVCSHAGDLGLTP